METQDWIDASSQYDMEAVSSVSGSVWYHTEREGSTYGEQAEPAVPSQSLDVRFVSSSALSQRWLVGIEPQRAPERNQLEVR